MNLPLPLIIACAIIILALIVFPLIISYKAEKKDVIMTKSDSSSEWEKIKEYGNKINKKNKNKIK
jgi:hypothetical protein